MSRYSKKKAPILRKSTVLGAVLPVFLLTSGLAIGELHADEGAKSEGKSESRDATEAVTDGWITTKVKSQLLVDQTVSGFDISVETRDNVVYLSGELENQAQVNHALEIARDTEGVKRVDATSLRIATAVDQVRDTLDPKDRG